MPASGGFALQRGLAAGKEAYAKAPPLEGEMRKRVFGIGAGI